MKTFFDTLNSKKGSLRPLADRLRPTSLEEVLGQSHILGMDAPLTRMINSQRLSSLIFWGPPGTGKTTIARLLSNQFDIEFFHTNSARRIMLDRSRNFLEGHMRLLQEIENCTLTKI